MASETTALHGLDDVDWEALEHADGNAYETPVYLRALLKADPAEREAARRWLFRMLVFDGRLYSASAAAVPFVVALAVDSATPDRPWALRLLAALAVGDTNATVETGFDVTAWEMRGYFKTEGAKPYRDAYRAVEVSLGKLLPMLKANDAKLRAAAAFATAFFARRADVVRRALTDAIVMEDEPTTLAAMLLSYGFQNGYLNDYDTSLLEGFLRRPSPVRLAAAVAMCRGVAPEPEALDVLTAALLEPGVAQPVPGCLWNDGYLAQMGITALMRQIPPEEQEANAGPLVTRAQELLLTLVERAPLVDVATTESTSPEMNEIELAIDALTTLYQTVAPAEPPERRWTRKTLPPMLRRFLEVATARPELMPDDMLPAIAAIGLPRDLEQLRALVGVERLEAGA